MIPQAVITAWRKNARWAGSDQVEHDLVLSRAICDLYQHPYYLFQTELKPILSRKVKIEINTRKHFNVRRYSAKLFSVENTWYNGASDVLTFSLEELLGTKLRALYQKKRKRSL